ncbi:MAG: CHAT domain-containing protein [Acidobacteriota bacterium]|nr:CHAT domain-containing protein [Acidobacteriota bacterium]
MTIRVEVASCLIGSLFLFMLASSMVSTGRFGLAPLSVRAQQTAPVSTELAGAEQLLAEARRLWSKALFAEDLVTAQRQSRQALDAFDAAGDQRGRARALIELGLIALRQKQPAEALNHFDQALNAARGVNDQALAAQVFEHLGRAQAAAGRPAEALDSYRAALSFYRENKLLREEVSVLVQLGDFHLNAGQTDQALQSYQQAHTLAQQRNDSDQMAEVLDRLAWTYNELGDAQQALDVATQALFAHRQVGDQLGEGYTLGMLGDLAREARQLDSALDFYQQALSLAMDVQAPALAWKMHTRLASIYDERGQSEAARSAYESAVQLIERVPIEATQDPFERAVPSSQDAALRHYADFLLRSNPSPADIEKAFLLTEQARARRFAELFLGLDHRGLGGVDPLKLEREHRLIQRLYDVRLALRDPALTDVERQTRRQQWEQAQADFDIFKADIRVVQPRYAELRYPAAPSIKTIQQALSHSDTILLSYLLEQRQSHLFVMTSNSLTVYPLPPADVINQSVESHWRLLTNPDREPAAESAPLMASSRQLYDMLIRPAEALLKNKKQLVIMPDGWLCYLPFDALAQDAAASPAAQASPKYMLESYTISYAPSADVWQRLRARRHNPSADRLLLVYGDMTWSPGGLTEKARAESVLVDLESEARVIAEALGARYADIRLRRRAEDAPLARAELNRYRLMHLAVPCVWDEREPRQSRMRLVWADGERPEPWVSLAHIVEQPIGAGLLTLSHCHPQFGQQVSGSGWLGLSRSFLYVGPSSLIASLWDAPDASVGLLMQAFYQHLRAGQSAAEALRLAKRQLAQMPSYRDPRYWARWALIGDGQTVIHVSLLAERVVIGSGILMAVVLAMLGIFLSKPRSGQSKSSI